MKNGFIYNLHNSYTIFFLTKEQKSKPLKMEKLRLKDLSCNECSNSETACFGEKANQNITRGENLSGFEGATDRLENEN